MTAQRSLALVGTYTTRGSKGVYAYAFDEHSGDLELLATAPKIENPTFLALHPSQPWLYAVCEVGDFQGKKAGGLTAFSYDKASGQMELINQQSTVGTGPCFVSVEATGRYALVANYGSGSVAMLPISEDGSLGEACDFHQYKGSSVDKRRQQEPHAHSIILDPSNRFALSADLGTDRIMVYHLDLEAGKLVPNDPPYAEVAPGQGPRHLAFHPNGRWLYLINEMGNTMMVYAWDGERGTLELLQQEDTLPADFEAVNHSADLHFLPGTPYLYGSNRGHDSMALFEIDADTGRMTPGGRYATGGHTPRNFCISPSGRFMLAGHQDSDNLVVHRIDRKTGALTPSGIEAKIPAAVCILMLPM